MKKALIVCLVLLAVFAGWLLLNPADNGALRLYDDQAYHFQALRALSHIPFGGADANEVLVTISRIPQGDDEAWFREWERTAKRLERKAHGYKDSFSKGRALLRAHNYFRTAEFFMDPKDPRKVPAFDNSSRVFYGALDALGVPYEIIEIPYGKYKLKAIYYSAGPKAKDKPLVVSCGGYDSTMEEMYFSIAAACLERGYDCLTYEGPGQSSVIRKQGLQFTPEWEKPTTAVLDEFLKQHPTDQKIVLVGMSLGGYLAPRAAAYEKRINGVVAFDVCYDFQEAALMQVPAAVRWLADTGMTGVVDFLINMKAKMTPGVRWGVNNAKWTMGAQSPSDLLKIFDQYNLRDVSKDITCDVLIVAGDEDHFFPVEQVQKFKDALTNARSVETLVYTRDDGGHEHCQMGAMQSYQEDLFEWISATIK